MLGSAITAMMQGMKCIICRVECEVADGLPMFNMVGYLSGEVKEARERILSAIRQLGYHLQPMRITMNISPGYFKKSGTGYDLPCALALLQAYAFLKCEYMDKIFFAGELSLKGEVKGINGILPMLIEASKQGYEYFVVPYENRAEAYKLPGIKVLPALSLKEVIDCLASFSPDSQEDDGFFKLNEAKVLHYASDNNNGITDFCNIKGQIMLKRACEVAASGMHNLLMIGPPGTGKSLIANAMSGILPELSEDEVLDVASVYSVAGLLNDEDELANKRPFRAPHHSISTPGLVGGGNPIRPGEISLANHGVLFLDELPEFKRQTIEVLRQPLEEKQIRITRATGTFDFPAHFSLVTAMNPCPCGFYPDLNRCKCTKVQIENYLNKISGPLLNRIDICVEVDEVKFKDMESEEKAESSEEIRERVTKTIERQKRRYVKHNFSYNSELTIEEIKKYCSLTSELKDYMEDIYNNMKLGARAYHRTLKVARTIADMAGRDEIILDDLNEALLYRGIMERYWGEKK
ncbi:MAG: YifB family Mg chelatase-like AAA ATPase [Lachnospiraceae bacterium]|nr:YifB family Mg chelatase-like AAA ATPase [Lachnospiraceae bacterium]